jgi:hypothetical protein
VIGQQLHDKAFLMVGPLMLDSARVFMWIFGRHRPVRRGRAGDRPIV